MTNYETDFLLWTEEQAKLLIAHKFDELDLINLIDEVEAMGKAELNKARSLLEQIFIHKFKLDNIPDKYNRNHWQHELNTFTNQLEDTLTASMRIKLETEIGKIWNRAKRDILLDYDLDLPQDCPYNLDEILECC